MMETEHSERTTNRIDRRSVLRAMGAGALIGAAGCLGGDDDASDDDGSGGNGDGGNGTGDSGGGGNGDGEDPYLREELQNAIANLDAPAPGSATVVFEASGEYRSESVECRTDAATPDDPEMGSTEGAFEFEDGAAFAVDLSRVDDLGAIRNTITLTVPNPADEGPEEYGIPRSLRGIKAEEGDDGRPAHVIKEDGTWYGGITFDSPDEVDREFGETWVAITCE